MDVSADPPLPPRDQPGTWRDLDLSSPLAAAQSYHARGAMPLPIPFRQKRPVLKNWNEFDVSELELPKYFNGQPQNIGILLGEPSGGLVDVDLDTPEALLVAPFFLPRTGVIFGRPGKPRSHWIYRVRVDIPRRQAWELKSDKAARVEGMMIVEIRGTGSQTIFPPSAHQDTGEEIAFDTVDDPGEVGIEVLRAMVAKVAAAALLARFWPSGSRWEAGLSLAGGLALSGWSEYQLAEFVGVVAKAAGDEETASRIRGAYATASKVASGQPVKGWPTLAGIVGDRVVRHVREWLGLKVESSLARSATTPYRACPNGMFYDKPTKDGVVPVQLSNFAAQITTETVVDDGAEQQRVLALSASQKDADTVNFELTTDQFQEMKWPMRHLGARAIIYPGFSTTSHLSVAIQSLSSDIVRRTVFAHTGWRQIGGVWMYLTGGGAIGPEGVVRDIEVRLDGALARYRLPAPPMGEDLVTAVQASMGLLRLGPASIVYPLYAAIWRSVICTSDFTPFLVGRTGTFKSETAALAQQHFGAEMNRLNLPGTWTSTGNALEDQTFRLKDAMFTIDDFKPSGHAGEDAKLQEKADRVLRAQGNGSGRQRLRQDLALRPPRPPRGTILCTGEDVPRGESLRGRCLFLHVQEGDIDVSRLGECQRAAAGGLYAQAVAGFVRWATPQYPKLVAEFRERSRQLRDTFAVAGGHSRLAGMLAELYVAIEIWTRFATDGTDELALTKQEASDLLEEARAAIMRAGRAQSAYQVSSDPVQRYCELLASAVGSGRAHLAGIDGTAPAAHLGGPKAWGWRAAETPDQAYSTNDWRPQGERVGWVDADGIYLDPSAAYKIVVAQGGSDPIAVSDTTLRRRLHDRKMLVQTERHDDTGSFTVRPYIEGKRRRVLHLRLDALGELGEAGGGSEIPI